ncbi:MAG TPA: substrate-binding and VWA domain-containing protein [Actinophytocola sp.]|uniref:substrate-binding and VWA domain-containing protein n=1 Tax=Actinophytocola sp. TaxID=1872138 RepID=UPI002DDCCF3D|nr:substrate-binding and VWA domain-containing protein [Actinophytocola sp.]HEV2784016.1 substrate-binding and VWA domain-containing protein [Actinophytocola sp.]
MATYLIFKPDAARKTCEQRIQLDLNSSTEKADLLNELANRYNAANRVLDGGRCAVVEVGKTTSGTAMDALAEGWNTKRTDAREPQVWTPTSSMWLDLLREKGKGQLLRDAKPASITRSVLSVAMPKQMADVLRREARGEPGWSDILKLAAREGGWGTVTGAKREWGKFQLGRDNPHISTSGLAATIAIYHAATLAVQKAGVTRADVDSSAVVKFVHDVESSVAHYGEDATLFMKTLYDEDQKQPEVPYISAVVVQEQLAFLYNKGAPTGDPAQLGKGATPHNPLVAIHPAEGTVVLDHPYVVLASATPDQRAAADDFREFLLKPEQQNRFADFGFRDLADRPRQDLADTLDFNVGEDLEVINPPQPDELNRMIAGWDAVRRPARVLLVLDVSGSMKELANPSGSDNKTRLDLVKPAALKGIELLGPHDEVGLWTFSTGPPGQLPYTELVPMSPVPAVKQRLVEAVNGLQPGGDTALYRTTRAAHKAMLERLDTKLINAIVLLSDGENHEPGNPDPASQDLDLLLNEINADRLENSVRIFTIPYSKEGHKEVLERIAVASKAGTYPASNPFDIEDVFVSVFRNF